MKKIFKNIKNILRKNSKTYALYNKISLLETELFNLENDLINSFDNTIFHYSAFGLHNAGDNLLVPALRKSIENKLDYQPRFISRNVRKEFTSEEAYLLNQTKGAIIGGGGLFLRDTNQNNISGWQFPISIKNLEKITVPMILLGVGYNRFRGQKEFDPIFKKNINAVVEKSSFVGIRNNGSIRNLKNYLRDDLKEKLMFHPCATTILSKLYNLPHYETEDYIALECAFDRTHLRFGRNQEKILNSIAKVIKEISKTYKIKYFSHRNDDLKMLKYLNKHKINYEVVNFNGNMSTEKFIELYSKPKLVIGMRGHAQMIPFGCKTPILSIISHDKLKWFLEDINHTEWGVDVISENFESDLLKAALYILNNYEKIKEEINIAQDKLYRITMDNLDIALKSLKESYD